MNIRQPIPRLLALYILVFTGLLGAVDSSFRGQLSGWLTGNTAEPGISQLGLQYIPEWTLSTKLGAGLAADLMLSLDAGSAADFAKSRETKITGDLEPYRLWLRLGGDRFEARIGLQKINFGSASLFRPLRWFDRIDPRDPLKRTAGVKGLLLRYYFPGNANIWFWGLLGNDDPKGWETLPTRKKGLEFGGRLQLPVPAGEAGVTFHHRRAQPAGLLNDFEPAAIDENRFALDCKLDITIGLWFEIAAVQRDTSLPLLRHQHMWTLGADYTFPLGNGLRILAEYSQTARTNRFFGAGEHSGFLGLSANYLITMLDQATAIYYWDHTRSDHYLWLNWQRTTDRWQFHIALFFNPQSAVFNGSPAATDTYAGSGFRLMIVFNH